jgi:5-deoxy-glucuronate isomerase
MQRYNADNLIFHAGNAADPDVIVEVTPEAAGWQHINFQVRRLAAGQAWRFSSGENELAIVPLGGSFDVKSERGEWGGLGRRNDVFSGLPAALYLPRRTSFEVNSVRGGEFAVAWTSTDVDNQPVLVTPADIKVEIRGGDNVTRQVNDILPPGFPAQKLVVVEVYTPGGNWSSYPPHKHDVHKKAADGSLVEADLEEIYYYKIDPPAGFAFQRIYTAAESPLHRAGYPIDAALVVHDNDVVLVPEGYHPVAAAPGYTAYYLTVLAGSAQSLANSEDAAYAWVKGNYRGRDARVPLYDVSAARSKE